MMDEFFQVVAQLPEVLARDLQQLSPEVASCVQEIRIRTGQPLQFTIGGRLVQAAAYLPSANSLGKNDSVFLQRCFLHLCNHSVYAHEQELRNGYLTIAGGHRVGVAGCWHDGYFSVVTSLNVRIARWILCPIPERVQEYLRNGHDGLLVAGAPGSGKTTFLRTLTQYLGAKSKIVCVVDERGELMAGQANGLPMAEQLHCDVYTHCQKAVGIMMALRCMNPHYIICDELGTQEDAVALEQGMASGVCFLASVHCDTPEDLSRKPQLLHLLHTGAFSAAVFLNGREKPGTVTEWVDLL